MFFSTSVLIISQPISKESPHMVALSLQRKHLLYMKIIKNFQLSVPPCLAPLISKCLQQWSLLKTSPLHCCHFIPCWSLPNHLFSQTYWTGTRLVTIKSTGSPSATPQILPQEIMHTAQESVFLLSTPGDLCRIQSHFSSAFVYLCIISEQSSWNHIFFTYYLYSQQKPPSYFIYIADTIKLELKYPHCHPNISRPRHTSHYLLFLQIYSEISGKNVHFPPSTHQCQHLNSTSYILLKKNFFIKWWLQHFFTFDFRIQELLDVRALE